jgi:hypothetical protein
MMWWVRAILVLAAVLVVLAFLIGGGLHWQVLLIVGVTCIPAFAAAMGTFLVVQRIGGRFGYSGVPLAYLGLALGIFGAAPLAVGAVSYLVAKLF